MSKRNWISKESVINDIASKEHFDINMKFANEVAKKINTESFKENSYLHYKTVYEILKNKLETLDVCEKNAYIDCLILNYTDLMDTKNIKRIIEIVKVFLKIFIDFLFGALSFTGILKISNLITFESEKTKYLLIFAMVFLCLFAILYIFVICIENKTRWKMYQMIFKQLKKEINM